MAILEVGGKGRAEANILHNSVVQAANYAKSEGFSLTHDEVASCLGWIILLTS